MEEVIFKKLTVKEKAWAQAGQGNPPQYMAIVGQNPDGTYTYIPGDLGKLGACGLAPHPICTTGGGGPAEPSSNQLCYPQ